ncbi:MAG: efflux RND transporter permease subunit [Candidatus Calescibacterium sp.]|nr:efflux RND transporter permease subunit [Candidatus Calescibacterium sp.]MCX7972245.1 efflux RND transporter permease subunit [bacterium]MDW8195154.1 efflux RND transporter permease subunit [Candidatus Calescibacterium sp.]
MIRLALEKWVAVFVLSVSILLMGIVSVINLKIELLPDINYPLIIITTVYPGASPERVERDLTQKIENVVSLVDNVKKITSTSAEGLSIVRAEFEWGTNLEYAIFDIRQKLDRIRDTLPDEAETPAINKQNVRSLLPVAFLALTGNFDRKYLRFLADEIVSKRLESVPGVGSTTVLGGLKREIQVIIDQESVYKYNFSVFNIVNSIRANNINIPTGYITLGNKDFTIRPFSEFHSLDEIKLVPVKFEPGKTIRVSDVAQVVDGTRDVQSYAISNFKPASYILVFKEADINSVDAVRRVRNAVPLINRSLPEGAELEVVFGFDERLVPIIRNIQEEALYASGLAVLIIFFFLLSFRSTIISAVSIPLSILATATGLYFNGTSINIISMGAVALAIGRIVDDSIVVIEAIQRNITTSTIKGVNDLKDVIVKGTNEVLPAIVASTLTTVIVFVPIVFIQGLARELFIDFAIVIILGLLASLVVAAFVVPPLFLLFYKNKYDIFHENFTDKLLGHVKKIYIKILLLALKNRLSTLLISFIIFLVSIFLVINTKKDFLPSGAFPVINVQVYNSVGGTLYDTYEKGLKVLEILYNTAIKHTDVLGATLSAGGDSEAISFIVSIAGVSTISSICETRIKFDSKDFNKYPIIVSEAREKINQIPGISINVTDTFRSLAGLGGTKQIEVVITGEDIDTLWELGNKYKSRFSRIPGVLDLDLSWKKGVPELKVEVDRRKAAFYGINTLDVTNLLQLSTSGTLAGKYKEKGYEYDIRVRIPKPINEQQMLNLPIFSPVMMKNIPLREIAYVKPDYGPVIVERYERVRCIRIYGNKEPTYSLSQILENMKKIFQEEPLPTGYTYMFKGEEEQRSDTFTAFTLIIILGIFLIYTVLAIQFNSLIQPFILMVSIPLEIIGVVIALNLFGTTLNLMSLMGILMVTGIVVSNAVLLIDYANKLRESQNLSVNDALIVAGTVRLKPILMTTLATIFAMIPLSMGLREGGYLLKPLAVAVIGGLTSSTLLTLIVVPVVYSVVEDIRKKFIKIK